MKRECVFWPTQALQLAVCLPLTLAWSSLAQTNFLFPVVTIRTTDPFATWSGDSGTFTVFRDGPTNATLNVYYRIDGTASNGVDYAKIPNWVDIPAGVRANTITISPINNSQTNFETVRLTLAQPPILPPVNYLIGFPSNATVYITSNPITNFPPFVRIATPSDGATFYAPVNVPICADARDLDGYVATVEFFAGTNSLGITTNNPYSAGVRNPFCLVWSNAPLGDYALTAKAADNGGGTGWSDPVHISVQPGPPPPPTNYSPVVRIISPPNGAIFRAPVHLPIYAYASDRDGYVNSVEFFAGTNSLGLGHGVCIGLTYTNRLCLTNLFLLVWTNAPLGAYSLTARATVLCGFCPQGEASAVSEPVNVTILPPPPPPTNFPPIVSIIATDPIAIEGTNCWVWPGTTNCPSSWSNWPGAICRSFTNCGPKNATFAVRRYGATNNDLTVTYHIGGTATNGVDYVTLPDSVTIPAGERHAQITVVPLDDGLPDITSTVILKLLPSTNYIIRFPAAAAAIIVDSDLPLLLTGLLPDRCFHFNAPGPDAAWFRIEYSTDLLNWTALATNQVVNGSIDFVDPDSQYDQARFYRVVPEANPPLE